MLTGIGLIGQYLRLFERKKAVSHCQKPHCLQDKAKSASRVLKQRKSHTQIRLTTACEQLGRSQECVSIENGLYK